MLQPVDCVMLLKLIAKRRERLTHRDLADELYLSRATVSVSIRRLFQSGLLRNDSNDEKVMPIFAASEELIIHAIKYFFPAEIGKFTKGIPTGIAAPIFEGKLVLGNDPIFVWPYEKGTHKGMALEPLISNVPKSVYVNQDEDFYTLLALVDTIRVGRARERNIAIKILKEVLNESS